MEHPPAAVINAIPISQNNPVPSITPRYFLCVRHLGLTKMTTFTHFYLPRTSISTLTFQTYISTTTYYIAYYLSLHGIWFNRYRLSLNPDSDLELNTPPTSRRQYWTKSLQGMSIAWSQISVVSTTILGWVFLVTGTQLSNILLTTGAQGISHLPTDGRRLE